MDIDNLKEILASLSTDEKQNLSASIQLIEEIQSSLNENDANNNVNAYSHLMLREKYFILIQNIIETRNEFMVKYVFRLLQKFSSEEFKCQLCSHKEKCQFVLNIFRYLQHTHIDHDLIKLEILTFPLNNHETIEPLLNSKILQSTIEIAITGWEHENQMIQYTAKALIIKYIAIVCNQITSYEKNKVKMNELNFDAYLVDLIACLLNVFNEEVRSTDLRSIMLECIELLLNNLLVESTRDCGYKIAENKLFLEFAWQHFCPSILFQFGESGILTSASLSASSKLGNPNAQTINFKTVYTILIQLTGLCGGNKSMIPVFEAIYQRILFYPPEQDRPILLKLFKTFINKEFVLSLSCIPQSDDLKQFDFTLISLFTGFYRNCYDKSTKQPEDKILQFLSSECICSFVDIINELYAQSIESNYHYSIKYECKPNVCLDKTLETEISQHSEKFFARFSYWLQSLIEEPGSPDIDLDLEIKKFCENDIQISAGCAKYLNSIKQYATVNFLLHDIFKPVGYFENVTENREYFVRRVIKYSCGGYSPSDAHSSRNEFKFWLNNIYDLNTKLKRSAKLDVKNERLRNQLKFVIKQMDSFFNYSLLFVPSSISKISMTKITTNIKTEKPSQCIELVKGLLKCSWIYLMDVLTGFLLNTQLNQLEQTLFFDSLDSASQKQLLQNENLARDLSFELVAFKSCLDSLIYIMSICSEFDCMDQELSQLIYLLEGASFAKTNFDSQFEVTLNQLVCLDLLFFASSRIVCNLNGEPRNKNYFFLRNNQILWNSLIESYFFCMNLSANQDSQHNENIHSAGGQAKPANLFEKTFKFTGRKSSASSAGSGSTNQYKLKKKPSFLFKSNFDSSLDTLENGIGREAKFIKHSATIDCSDWTGDYSQQQMSVQQELILKNLFLFITQQTTPQHHKRQIFNKQDLTESLANHMDTYLNEKLFKCLDSYLSNSESSEMALDMFDYIWIYSAQMCTFSRRYLNNASKDSTTHEHITFNHLIIDKLDSLVSQLIEKFSFSADNIVLNVASAPAPPLSTRNDEPFFFKPFSLYSMFITDLWLNVFTSYFVHVCSKLFDSSSSNSTKRASTQQDNQEINAPNEPYCLIDLSICKKLITLMQKSFETYLNITSCRSYIQLATNSIERPFNSSSSSTVSSLASSSSSSLNNEIDSLILDPESQNLLAKLGLETSIKQQQQQSTVVNQLLLNSTTSFLLDTKQKKSHENDNDLLFRKLCSIDESCHFNSFFLLPFQQLMRKNKLLDAHLQDAILATISEVVETHSIRIKSAWQCLFSCLDKVNLNSKNNKREYLSNHPSMSSSFSSNESSYRSVSSSSSSISSLSSSSSSLFSLENVVSFKFDPIRVRYSSLIDIFNVYLSLASHSACVLAQGSFELIRCIANYLQYSSDIKMLSVEDIIQMKSITSHSIHDLNTIDENTLTSSTGAGATILSDTNDRHDERYNLITSDYDHLCELSRSNNTNTLVRPFLDCYDKLFSILTNKCSLSLQPVYQIDSLTFQMKCISIENACSESFEVVSEFSRLNELMSSYLKENDSRNLFKLLSFLIESIALRICAAYDELNCVQLALYLDSLMSRLLDMKQYVLVGYALLQIILRTLAAQIDFIELKLVKSLKQFGKKRKLVNEKLFKNVLFLANLMEKRVESCVCLLRRLVLEQNTCKSNELMMLLINCSVSRLFNLLNKLLVTKLSRFDSVVEFNVKEPLKDLYVSLLKLNDTAINLKCSNSIGIFHLESLKQFTNLIQNYSCNENHTKTDDNKEENYLFLNLEVIANDHLLKASPWRCYSIKKAFEIARDILFYRIRSETETVSNYENETRSKIDQEDDDDDHLPNDENSFYRDISLKFRSNERSFALSSDQYQNREVNLTCFIIAYKFHLSLVDLIGRMENEKFLPLLNETYLISLKMDTFLSFKILLSKLFFSNHESNQLANFVHLTRATYASMNPLIQINEMKETPFLIDNLELKMTESANEAHNYFAYFIRHLANNYYDLNEKSHLFKMEKSYLKNLKNSSSDDSDEQKAAKLFKMHQEHNKAVMLSFTGENSTDETQLSSSSLGGQRSQLLLDNKNRYQVWSQQIIAPFLVNLNEKISLNKTSPALLDAITCICQLFNSCSPYCQCLAFGQNELIERAKCSSLHLMTEFFRLANSNVE